MINIPHMTAMFARMTPEQRKNYAQDHSDDPYTVALLMNMDTQEKALRTAMQGEAQGQEGQQPPVVDQAIAQMGEPEGQAQEMPEDVGIATLPQQTEPLSMAEGGIVSFTRGGDVQRFNQGGSAFSRWWDQRGKDVAQREETEALRDKVAAQYYGRAGLVGFFSPQTDPQRQEAKDVISALNNLTYEQLQRVNAQGPAALAGFNKSVAARHTGVNVLTGAQPPTAPITPTPTYRDETRLRDAGKTAPNPLAELKGAQDKGKEPPVDVRPAMAPAGTTAPAMAPEMKSYLELVQQARNAQGVDLNITEHDAINKARSDSTAAGQKAFEEGVLAQAGRFDKRKARDDASEKELGERDKKDSAMALIGAGARMMQTRGGFGNVMGQGLDEWTRGRSAGIKDLRLAQKDLAASRDRTEDREADDTAATGRERRALDTAARESGITGLERKLDAARGFQKKQDEEARDTAKAGAAAQEGVAARASKAEIYRLNNLSAERIASNANYSAIMRDTRAGERAQLDAARALMKSAGEMVTANTFDLLEPAVKTQLRKDYADSRAVLLKLSGAPDPFKQPPPVKAGANALQ